MSYHQVCNKSNTTGDHCWSRNCLSFWSTWVHPRFFVFCFVRVSQSWVVPGRYFEGIILPSLMTRQQLLWKCKLFFAHSWHYFKHILLFNNKQLDRTQVSQLISWLIAGLFCNKNNTTSATNWAGTAYHSGTPEFTSCCLVFVFLTPFSVYYLCGPLFVSLSCFFYNFRFLVLTFQIFLVI